MKKKSKSETFLIKLKFKIKLFTYVASRICLILSLGCKDLEMCQFESLFCIILCDFDTYLQKK